MRLVVDASVLVRLCLEAEGFALLSSHVLHTPALGRSESLSTLHELAWRKEISQPLARAGKDRLLAAPLVHVPDAHLAEAWLIAERAGWAKTYDAEYVAAARLLGVPLLTLDLRLERGAARFVETLTPDELP